MRGVGTPGDVSSTSKPFLTRYSTDFSCFFLTALLIKFLGLLPFFKR